MRKIRSPAAASFVILAASIVSVAAPAWAAAPIRGAIMGQVRDLDTGGPVAKVTVTASGPEGDTATVTDGKGLYHFLDLPVGAYSIRFQRNDVFAEREATLSVDKTVRVNIRMPAVPAEVETIAVVSAAPAIDVGSSRIGTTFTSDFIDNVPNVGRDVASLLQKTPGGYNDTPSDYKGFGLSLAGGTGADNAYYLEGLNVTALRDGLLGTNLRIAFLDEAEVISSGYGAEYGRALGGVVNMVLKSGTNEWKGSAFSSVAPSFLAGSPRRILSRSTVVTGVTEPDYTTELGAEVGGPIIKNKLFVWFGYAPEISRSHMVQYFDRYTALDANGDPKSNPDGSPIVENLFTRVIPNESTTHNFAGKLTLRLAPEHVVSVSLVGIRSDEEYMRNANMDLIAGLWHERTSRNDLIARWQSALFQRTWRIDASLGLHTEGFSRRSAFGDAESTNGVIWNNSPSLSQFYPDPSITQLCQDGQGGNLCPVQGYQSGGQSGNYGVLRDISSYRLAGQIKSTHVFSGFGLHELKYGLDYELVHYDDARWNSGMDGSRGVVWVFPGNNPGETAPTVLSMYRLPYNTRVPLPDQDHNQRPLLYSPYYQDTIRAMTDALNQGAFAQESYMPLSNLTVNLGLRWEAQRIYDYTGAKVLSITDNIAPRVGAIYDPTKEGRSKIFAHYGRFYESIPMDLANRAFGGEGVVGSDYGPGCNMSTTNWRNCAPAAVYSLSGDRLTVQPNIKGSFNHELVAGAQYHYVRGLVVGAAVVYRWLGRVIEDYGGDLATATGISTLGNATDPKPERTYKAIQLTVNKLLADHWLLAGSYTYSRTTGNYAGLYSADSGQLDPNLTSQFDYASLMANRNGPLPNDRPHIVHLDGYYQFGWGRHMLTPGLSFVGQSGVPITPLGRAPIQGENEAFILPRGAAGRTDFFTQLDVRLSYRAKMSQKLSVEAYVDIFNVLNQKTELTVDQEYTVSRVMPMSAGTPLAGVPVVNGSGTVCGTGPGQDSSCTAGVAQANPNYRRATSYQAPISGRLGMRIWF